MPRRSGAPPPGRPPSRQPGDPWSLTQGSPVQRRFVAAFTVSPRSRRQGSSWGLATRSDHRLRTGPGTRDLDRGPIASKRAPAVLPIPPPAYGGTESVVDRLARGLVAAGHDVLLAAADNSTCPVPRVTGTDPAGVAAPVCGDTVTELRHVLTSYAAMTDVEIIHDHTLAGPCAAARTRRRS
jgi:hypothetical protein